MAQPAVIQDSARGVRYERHRPEDTVLYRTIRQHWGEFCERAEEASGLPRFVVREVEEYLRCGLLPFGCIRVGCERCGFERLVAFSCMRRGFCPSCVGRRMSDTAVHIVEKVLPEVPIRQWVCSLPWRLRVHLGYDRKLCAECPRIDESEGVRIEHDSARRGDFFATRARYHAPIAGAARRETSIAISRKRSRGQDAAR